MRIIRGIAIAAVVIVAVAFQFQKGTVKAQTETRPQIGSVNGQSVLAEKADRALSAFVLRHGKPPATEADNQEIASISAQENCNSIKGAITKAAQETQKRRYAIAVSPDEVKEASNFYWSTHDPAVELKQRQQQAVARSTAASDVYDKGQDPETVYQTLIKPLDDPKTPAATSHLAWQATLPRWRDPAVRARLAAAAMTAQQTTIADINRGVDKASQELLEQRKLADTIDTELAAQDPKFRADFNSSKPPTTKNPWQGQGRSETDYMRQKRAEFWQARYAEQKVTLSDPTLASQCQLSALGVTPH